MDMNRIQSLFSEVDDLDSATLDPAEVTCRKQLADGKTGAKEMIEESAPKIHPDMTIRDSNMSYDGL